MNPDVKWAQIDRIIDRVVTFEDKPPSLMQRIDEITLNPIVNLAIAFVVLYSIFVSFVRIGHIFFTEQVIGRYIFAQGTFYDLWIHRIFDDTFLFPIMVGNTDQGYLYSFGLLTTGLYVPLGIVLPAIFVFYAWLTILEDIGYLPRLAMLADSLLRKIGLPGYAIVPTILGMGCNVPGMTATRILDTKKQRFTLSTILAIAVPCNAQISIAIVIIGGMYGYSYLIPVVLVLVFLYAGIGALLNHLIPSKNLEMLMEIPPYRRPLLRNVASKLMIRMRCFFFDAVPWVLIGILVVNILYLSGVLEILENVIGPILVTWLGIPAEMVGALVIGFLRKDIAIAFFYLIPDMSVWQAITGVVILMIYFPCAATFAMMLKEQGFRDTLKSTGLMLIIAFMVGGMLHAVSLLW